MTLSHSGFVLSGCAVCDDALEHCHGTAIVHVRRGLECTDDPDCRLPEELHAYVVLCIELNDACCES